jgi:hypothetical protein
MHPDLMSSSRVWDPVNQAEFVGSKGASAGYAEPGEPSLDAKFSLRRRSSRVNRLLEPDLGFLVYTLSI